MGVVKNMALSNIGVTDWFAKDISKTVIQHALEEQRLFVLLTKLSEKQTASQTNIWFEQLPQLTKLIYTGADEASAAATLLIGADYLMCLKDTILVNTRTFEHIKVSADATTSTVACTSGRDFTGEQPGALLKSGDELAILNQTPEELLANTTGVYREPTRKYNLTQTIEKRTPLIDIQEVLSDLEVSGPGMVDRSLEQTEYAFREMIENQLAVQGRVQATGTTLKYTLFGGLRFFLTDHTWPMVGISEFTESALDDFFRSCNRYNRGPKDRWFVVSEYLRSRMSNWGRNRLTYNDKLSADLGFEVMDLHGSTGGTLKVVEAPIFQGNNMGYWGFVLNMKYISLKWMKKPTLEMNVQTPGANYQQNKIWAILTLEVGNSASQGFIYKAA